jgi:hypothetical protein
VPEIGVPEKLKLEFPLLTKVMGRELDDPNATEENEREFVERVAVGPVPTPDRPIVCGPETFEPP